MLAFVTPFNSTVLPSGLVSWPRCHALYRDLLSAVSIPASLERPAVHASYQSYLSVHIHSAVMGARKHGAESMRIARDEEREKTARERVVVGMRPR